MHFLQKKKLTKIGQIWLRQLLKENTAAYRGSPPCTQSQYIPTERRVQQFTDQYRATDFPRHDFPLNILAIIITTIKTITTTNIIIIIIIIISVIIISSLQFFFTSPPDHSAPHSLFHLALCQPLQICPLQLFTLSLSRPSTESPKIWTIFFMDSCCCFKGSNTMLWVLITKRGGGRPLVCNSFFEEKNLQILPH